MTAQPTPGPWFAYGRYIGTASHKSYIGECRSASGCWSDDEPASANARLIAAAPDLLEALKLCVPTGVCFTNRNLRDDMIVPLDVPMGDLRKIVAAITKATGQ